MGRESCHCKSHSTSPAELSVSHQLSPRDLLLPSSIKPFPAWNREKECGEGRADYPLPSCLLAQQPQHSSHGMMLRPLSALILCFAPGSPSTLLLSPFLLPSEVLSHPSHREWSSSALSFSQLLRLRCNKFVGSATGQLLAQQTRCAHLGGAVCPNPHILCS